MTDSTLGSGQQIYVRMYDKESNYISTVGVKFSSPMRYWIYYCTSSTDLPVEPPTKVDKIWKIIKTETAIIITCNDVEVLKYLFADSPESGCVTRVGGGDLEQILFTSGYDTASDYYRAGKTHIYKKYLALVFKKLPAWH